MTSDILDVLGGQRRSVVVEDESLDVIRSLPTASVDVILTDPPYAATGDAASIVRVAGSKTPSLPKETQFFEAWIREHLKEWRRVAIRGAWFTIDWRGAMAVDTACSRLELPQPAVGVWDRGGLGMGYVLRRTYECWCVVPFDGFERIRTDEADVWREQWTPGDRSTGHSAEKPVLLFQRALRLLLPDTQTDGIVLDPFCGSGSSGMAAMRRGLRYIGVERDDRFAQMARDRIQAEHTVSTPQAIRAGQLAMFGGGKEPGR